jgi:cation transport ATPase
MSDRVASVMDAHEIGVVSYRKTEQRLALASSFNGAGVVAAVTGLISPVWAMIAAKACRSAQESIEKYSAILARS